MIEIDGGQHFDAEAAEKDARRSAALRALGLTVMRFTNREVMRELDRVVAVIAGCVAPSP